MIIQRYYRLRGHPDGSNRSIIVVTDTACIQGILGLSRSGAKGSSQYNLVQQALWPRTPFMNTTADSTEDAADGNDLPGSWTSANAHRGPLQLPQNGHMAHSMRIGRVLRPVPAPTSRLLKASPQHNIL